MSVSYISKGTAATGNATSITVTLPSNKAAGQFCVIYAYTYAYSSGMIWSVTSGWTKFIDYKNGTYGSLCAAYKILTGTEANPVISFSGPTKESIVGESMTFSGVDVNGVLFDVSATAQTGTGAASTPWDNAITEITTATDGAMAVYIYGIKDNLTSTISNFTEQDDTGTAAGSDAQACFATKAMATAGGVGSSNLNYGSGGNGLGYVVYKFALKPAVSVSVSPVASSFITGTTNPTTILGLISFAPASISFNLASTDPTIVGQGILLEIFTELGGAMSLASYALLYDANGVEIDSTGGYIQGTGIAITDVTNIEGFLWTADIAAVDLVSASIGKISIYDEYDILICSWTFQPALDIDQSVFTFNWPETGITFPSPQYITTESAQSDYSTTNPTVIYGSLVYEPNISNFDINTTNPYIPPSPSITIYPIGNPVNASYVLILDEYENEIISTGNYVHGTGISLSNISYIDNKLYANDFIIDIVAETNIYYLDVYDSNDNILIRWTTGIPLTISNESIIFGWPDSGVGFSASILDIEPIPIDCDFSTAELTLLFGSTLSSPSAVALVMSSTDPTVIISLSGSILYTPASVIYNLNTTDPLAIQNSISINPNYLRVGLKTIAPSVVKDLARNLKYEMGFEIEA